MPALASAAGLLVLIGLGNWQMDRLSWKNELQRQINSRAKAEPMTLEQALTIFSDDKGIEYRRVQLRGRFLHDREIHLYALREGRQGWRIITPVETDTGRFVLVDRGFVPEGRKEAATRSKGQVAGEVKIVGLARAGVTAKSLFENDNNVSANRWFWRDHAGMVQTALGEQRNVSASGTRVVPFFLESEATEIAGDAPEGGGTRLELPNKHLGYALTWYGLGVTLVAVFAAFAFSRVKEMEGAL